MNNCENCYHFEVCENYLAELGYTLGVDYKATRCPFYKDKSLLIERKALHGKVEELLIGHGYINPDTAISECLKIIENFPTADVPPCNSDTVSTDCKDYPNCKGCPIDASGGCDRE